MKNRILSILVVLTMGLVAATQNPANASPTMPLEGSEATPNDCVWETCSVDAKCPWKSGQWACFCCGGCTGNDCVPRTVCRATGGAFPAC